MKELVVLLFFQIMPKTMVRFLIIFLLSVGFGCKQRDVETIIPIISNIEELTKIDCNKFLSEIAQQVDYIPLETRDGRMATSTGRNNRRSPLCYLRYGIIGVKTGK